MDSFLAVLTQAAWWWFAVYAGYVLVCVFLFLALCYHLYSMYQEWKD